MKAQDLRIGNLVKVNDKIFKVSIVKDEFINCYLTTPTQEYKHTPSISINNVKPIPLTEEWLLKMGFNKDVKGNYRTNHYMFIERWYISHKEKYDKNFFSLIIHEDFITHINTVNQLQNLYFSLTGEELTINN